jgi:hypothetical protein
MSIVSTLALCLVYNSGGSLHLTHIPDSIVRLRFCFLLQLNTSLKAKVDMLRTNLAEVRDDAERSNVLEKEVSSLREQLEQSTVSDKQPSSNVSCFLQYSAPGSLGHRWLVT